MFSKIIFFIFVLLNLDTHEISITKFNFRNFVQFLPIS